MWSTWSCRGCFVKSKKIKNKLPQGVHEWPDPFFVHAGTTNAGDPAVEEVLRNLVVPSLRRIEALGDPFACVSSDDNGITTEDELETTSDRPSKRMCPNPPTIDSGSE
jgi:hypothetical protein